MRKRRTHRIDLTQADRLAAGDPPGSDHPGLGDLLDAARAPATAEELTGEKAVVAAFTAHRRRAAREGRRADRTQRKALRTRGDTATRTTRDTTANNRRGNRTSRETEVTVGARGAPIGRAARKRKPLKARAAAVAAGLALLTLGGTAAAARTGHLPPEAQQHAHRLFSALGVPAPRTGPTPSPTTTGKPTPSATPSPDSAALSWCEAWRGGAGTKPPLTSENRKKLIAEAGGEKQIADYCATLSASPAPSAQVPGSAVPGPAGSEPPTPPTTTPEPDPTRTKKPKPSVPTPDGLAPTGRGPTDRGPTGRGPARPTPAGPGPIGAAPTGPAPAEAAPTGVARPAPAPTATPTETVTPG